MSLDPQKFLALMEFPILEALMPHLTDRDAITLQLLNSTARTKIQMSAPQGDVRGWAGKQTCKHVTEYFLGGQPHSSQCYHVVRDEHRCKGLQAPFTAIPQEPHRHSNLCDTHHEEVASEFEAQIYGLGEKAQQGLCRGCEIRHWGEYERSERAAGSCRCGGSIMKNHRCRACYVELVKQMEERFAESLAEFGDAEGDLRCFCGREHNNHEQWRVYGCYICRQVKIADFESEELRFLVALDG